MNPINKMLNKYKSMSNRDLLIELGTLVFQSYNIKSIIVHHMIKYAIRILLYELSRRL